jgi:hypothetical protein
MNNLDYDAIFSTLIQKVGNISNFEQLALLLHAIFIKHNLANSDHLSPEWNKEYGVCEFRYHPKRNNNTMDILLTLIQENNGFTIKVQAKKDNNTQTFSISFSNNDEAINKIDYNNLNETIKDLEKRIRSTCLEDIMKTLDTHTVVNNSIPNYNPNPYIYDPIFTSEEFDPNKDLHVYNPEGGLQPNPYFSTGGGAVPGGNYVGPNADVFSGNFVRPPGGHKIRYDPIGPFGTFGGKPKGIDPFGKGPFGGGNGGDGPFI